MVKARESINGMSEFVQIKPVIDTTKYKQQKRDEDETDLKSQNIALLFLMDEYLCVCV